MAQYEGRKVKTLDVYDSIEVLPLFNFDKYRSTGDNNWFLTAYSGKEKRIESELLKQAELKCCDEYEKATDDRSFQLTLQTYVKISNIQTKFNLVLGLIDTMAQGFTPDAKSQEIRAQMIQVMCDWGYPMNIIATPVEDLMRLREINDELPGLKTQIAILREKIKITTAKQSQSLNRQMRVVQIGLGLKSDYNPRTITVSQWIDDCKMLEEISKQN